MKYPSYKIEEFNAKFKDDEYDSLLKLLTHSHWIRYENGEIDLLPKSIINQPNIFLLTVNDNNFMKFEQYFGIMPNKIETIVKELMEYR